MTEVLNPPLTRSEQLSLLVVRATLATATANLCAGWLAGIGLVEDGCSEDAARAGLADDIHAFTRAWLDLADQENPEPAVTLALDGFMEDVGTDPNIAPKLCAMLRGEVITPVVRRLTGNLAADMGLQTPLEALRVAVHHHDGGDHPPHLQAAMHDVRAAIHSAADRGVSPKLMQATLNSWTGTTGGPRIELDGLVPV